LTAILAEISPLRLFSSHVYPWLSATLAFLCIPVQAPRWFFCLGPVAGALFIVLGRYGIHYLRRKKSVKIVQGLCWEKSPEREGTFRPICNKCQLPLQLRSEAESRTDRNNLPFQVIPESPNTLVCVQCNYRVRLQRPWSEVSETASVFLTALFSRSSLTALPHHRPVGEKDINHGEPQSPRLPR